MSHSRQRLPTLAEGAQVVQCSVHPDPLLRPTPHPPSPGPGPLAGRPSSPAPAVYPPLRSRHRYGVLCPAADGVDARAEQRPHHLWERHLVRRAMPQLPVLATAPRRHCVEACSVGRVRQQHCCYALERHRSVGTGACCIGRLGGCRILAPFPVGPAGSRAIERRAGGSGAC